MSEMIERVAKAIAGYMHPDRLDKYWDDWIGEEERRHYRVQARAAIEAMREPTVEMVEAVDIEGETDAGGGINATYSVGSEEAKKVWQAMVDRALKD